MTVAPAVRASLLLFVAALVQVVMVPPYVLGGGAPDLLLLVVVSLGLLRGSVAGAAYGFAGGLLVDLVKRPVNSSSRGFRLQAELPDVPGGHQSSG